MSQGCGPAKQRGSDCSEKEAGSSLSSMRTALLGGISGLASAGSVGARLEVDKGRSSNGVADGVGVVSGEEGAIDDVLGNPLARLAVALLGVALLGVALGLAGRSARRCSRTHLRLRTQAVGNLAR